MKSTSVLAAAPLIVLGAAGPALAADIVYPAADLMAPPPIEETFKVAHNEILAIGNVGEGESYFAMVSYRHSFKDPDNGLKVRFDAAYSTYNFEAISSTDGDEWRGRALAGYAHEVGAGAVVTFYGGAEYFDRNYTPDLIGSPDISQWGAFGSVELSADVAGGGNFFAGVEYSTNQESVYTGFHYLHPLHDGFLLGPTANYLHNDSYERWAAGAKAEFNVSDYSTFSLIGAYGQDSVNGAAFDDTWYVEASHSIKF